MKYYEEAFPFLLFLLQYFKSCKLLLFFFSTKNFKK
uniref:Uncharacterized protein n=1 Tax=Anguilla anguilla TaxID=7936 RepID=A0A0E9QSL1_ANGAN